MNRTVVIFMKFRLIWLLGAAIVVMAALCILHPFPLAAEEPLQLKLNIATILADPSKYMSQMVSLEGTVQHPALWEAPWSRGGHYTKKCLQRFMLEDNTGSISAIFNFFCDVPERQSLTLSHGDQVMVQGYIGSTAPNSQGNVLNITLDVKKLARP